MRGSSIILSKCCYHMVTIVKLLQDIHCRIYLHICIYENGLCFIRNCSWSQVFFGGRLWALLGNIRRKNGVRVDIFLSQIQMTYRCYEGTKTAYCSLGKDMQPLR